MYSNNREYKLCIEGDPAFQPGPGNYYRSIWFYCYKYGGRNSLHF